MTVSRTFTDLNDSFSVTSGSYDLEFLGGDDRLILRGGTTRAYLGSGDDFVRIYGGSAQIYGQQGNDRFEIFGSDSRVNGGTGNDTFVIGGGANHVLVGRDGDDRFNFTSNVTSALLSGDDGNDTFVGNSHSISGSISGGAGNDHFLMFGNHDGREIDLYGGTGNDLYRVDPDSPATIIENAGEGNDTVQVAVGSTYTLGANLENLVANAFATVGDQTTLTGNDLANRITGSAISDAIDGGAGNDRIVGLGGDDYLIGGDGDDRIYGGMGIDAMAGGAGNDTFVFTSGAESPYDPSWNEDSIADFDAGDRIDVSAIDANSQMAGIQHFQVVAGPGHEAGTLHYSGDPGGWGVIIVEGYIDGDDQPDLNFLIWTNDMMGGYPPVTESSFITG